MAVELNHSIIWCSDKARSAGFLAEMLGRPAPVPFHHFLVVDLDNGVSLDFMEKDGRVAPQHYAFLVDEASFDAVLGRIRARGLDHWADPARPGPARSTIWAAAGASTSPIPTAICSKRSPGPIRGTDSSRNELACGDHQAEQS
jgi:hypothetical protein